MPRLPAGTLLAAVTALGLSALAAPPASVSPAPVSPAPVSPAPVSPAPVSPAAAGVAPVGAAPAEPAAATTIYITRRAYAKLLRERINISRVRRGVAPVRQSWRLTLAAHRHNQWMARYNLRSHQLPGEPSFTTRLHKAGVAFTRAGENVGYTTNISAQGVLDLHLMMMREGPPPPGYTNHYSTILNRAFRYVGVDVIYDPAHRKLWITEDFADRG